MKIKLIVFGKIKNREMQVLMEYYMRLTSKYCKVEVVNLRDTEQKVTLESAGKIFNTGDYVIALDEAGQQLGTIDFARKLANLRDESRDLTFLIGNAYGLDEQVLDKADLRLAFGKMTLPHEMVYVILTEQLFRCFNYLSGGKYHK